MSLRQKGMAVAALTGCGGIRMKGKGKDCHRPREGQMVATCCNGSRVQVQTRKE